MVVGMIELTEIRSFGEGQSNVRLWSRLGFLQEEGTQRTRIVCKRKANIGMFMWPTEKEYACCERG